MIDFQAEKSKLSEEDPNSKNGIMAEELAQKDTKSNWSEDIESQRLLSVSSILFLISKLGNQSTSW